jgi:general secretion pathway protein A
MEFWYGNAYLFWKDFQVRGRFLAKGKSGDAVVWLQNCLKDLGYYTGEMTGIFASDTERAVQSFQKDHFLEEDGVLGPQTKIVLYQELKAYSMPTLMALQARERVSEEQDMEKVIKEP